MAAPKGHKKWGGRAKGTPNKPTQTLIEKARELGIDPFEVVLLFAKGDWKALGYKADVISPDLRAACAKDACQYMHAKRKAMEHSGPDGGPIEVRDVSAMSPEERAARLIELLALREAAKK